MRKILPFVTALIVFSGLVTIRTAFAKDNATVQPTAMEISITSKVPAAVETFKKGRDYAEDIRTDESIVEFKKAIELDPEFALAHAYLGAETPGREGLEHLERAAQLTKGLPEPERIRIDIMVADRKGEEEKSRTLWKKLATIVPNDWRVHAGLGAQFSADRKWNEAIAELMKAVDLNPNSGTVFNTLGYTYLAMGKNDEAAMALKKYADLKPTEPNPQDSYAEALMAAGKFDEAEAAFRKAAEISPSFWVAWDGVAQTRFLRDDWAGGRDALAKAKAGANRPADKLDEDLAIAWSYAAAGDYNQAFTLLDAADKTAEAEKVDVLGAFIPVDRAIMLNRTGKHEQAIAQANLAIDKGQKANIPGGPMNVLRRDALTVRIDAESKLGQAAEAKKTLALLEAEAKKAPSNANLQSAVHFARGAEAMARGDAKAAVTNYSQCDDDDYYGRLSLAMAQDKAGDKSGAAATRAKLLSANRRGPYYLWVRTAVKETEEAAVR